ncbi:POTRA domain-containing protein [Candidatus Marifrigoribacter sp. Uisw_064]|uniref:POTRA domain-containing protein n=1 Tax=Candidatus Marifrigoribacter sp. Uisw_064 TaxID=3230970 RepID=UPI003D4A2F89
MILTIKAKESINESVLDSLNYQREFKNLKTLISEIDSVQSKLNAKGYIENNRKTIVKENDSSFVSEINFGTKYRHVKIFYKSSDFLKEDLQQVSTIISEDYFIIPFSSIEQSLQKLKSIKTEEGNPFLKIQLTDISVEENQTLSANLNFKKGNKRTIDKIIIKGYDKFPKSFLKYYAGIKAGTPFVQNKITQQNETLNNLGFTETIKPPEALFKKDSTSVYFYLKKQNNNKFDGILGFSTDEESNKLIFNGFLNLELNNNLNAGEKLTINYKADGNEQQNFKVTVDIPYLFNSPIGLGLGLSIFKRDTTFLTTEQIIKTTYQINTKSKGYLGYKSKESTNLLSDKITGLDLEDYTSKYIISGVSHSILQSRSLSPIKSLVVIDTEIGTRKINSKKEQQFQLSLNLHHILNLNSRNSIYLRNSSSFLKSDRYLENELLRFGGINSIRGFNENSIDASFFTTLNTEYRYLINESFYLHTIVDIGYFENQSTTIKEKLYSFGFGMGMKTKAGIFKFNVANGNSGNQTFNFSNTKIHLSLTSQF